MTAGTDQQAADSVDAHLQSILMGQSGIGEDLDKLMQTQDSPRRRQKYDKVDLPGCIDELIRIPTTSLYKT